MIQRPLILYPKPKPLISKPELERTSPASVYNDDYAGGKMPLREKTPTLKQNMMTMMIMMEEVMRRG